MIPTKEILAPFERHIYTLAPSERLIQETPNFHHQHQRTNIDRDLKKKESDRTGRDLRIQTNKSF
jgi:hypothetical protein